jgi:hypothetical protein
MAEARRRAPRARRSQRPPATGAEGQTAGKTAPTGSEPSPPLCSVAFCPICTFVTAVGEVRPELVEHLVLASREVLLAVRALIDSRLEGMPTPPPKLERLTIG